MSNVHIQNLKGEKFDTDLLYWDQNKHTIYSDRFIRTGSLLVVVSTLTNK